MEARRIGPVVVGIDGSANARRAMVEAARIALAENAELVVVHAVGLTDVIHDERVPSFGHRDEIAQNVTEWCEVLGGVDCPEFRTELVDGPPVDVLLRTAQETDASLIVVGRRGAGGRPELLLGSTAHQIVEHSHCPVLIIPPLAHPTATGDESG